MGGNSFVFRFADIEVREREFSLTKAGECLSVESKAFRVLLILLRNPGRLIPKQELLDAVWGDAAVTENSLARAVALLHKALADEARTPRFIETVATVGYRFLCKVEASEDALETPGTTAEPIAAASDRNQQQMGQVLDAPATSVLPASAVGPVVAGKRINRTLVAAITVILFLIATYLAIRHSARPKVPTVTSIVRLTND
jgi:DNA-binding winged helix-turn-helix (wHTH) protein